MRTYNIKDTYVEEDEPSLGILAAASFVIFSLGQLYFVHDMILPIKYKVGWEKISQQIQMQIN